MHVIMGGQRNEAKERVDLRISVGGGCLACVPPQCETVAGGHRRDAPNRSKAERQMQICGFNMRLSFVQGANAYLHMRSAMPFYSNHKRLAALQLAPSGEDSV
ncbi:unnamed protein product [Ectocarpus fasciculatus]